MPSLVLCESTNSSVDLRGESESTITSYNDSEGGQNVTRTSIYCSDCGVQNVSGQGVNKCTSCQAKFVGQTASESVLNRDMDSIRFDPFSTTSDTFKCPFCLTVYYCALSLIEHLKTHNLWDKCGENSRQPFSEHLDEPDNGPLNESNTSKESSGSINILPCQVNLISNQQQNEKEVVQKVKHVRNKRGKKQNDKKNIQIRLKEKKPYSCLECSKAFTTSGNLKAHFRTHTDERPYVCVYCNRSFRHNRNLVAHVRIHTGEAPYQCVYCNRGFKVYTHLKVHLRVHTGETPYQCVICNRGFKQYANLIVHLRIHTGETPYQCVICNRGFRQNGALEGHIRTHTGENPFTCKHCLRSFRHKQSLRDHIRSHTGEEPYACQQCGRTYTILTSLKYHERTHLGKKPFACERCSYTSAHKGHLKVHYSRVHKIKNYNM